MGVNIVMTKNQELLINFIKNDSNIYYDILNSINVGVYIVDSERTIVFWSTGAETLTGKSKESMVGKKCFETGLNHKDCKGNVLCSGFCPLVATMFDGQVRHAKVKASYQVDKHEYTEVHTFPIIYNEDVIGAYEIFYLRPGDPDEE